MIMVVRLDQALGDFFRGCGKGWIVMDTDEPVSHGVGA